MINQEKHMKSVQLINEIVSKYETMREFARTIQEERSDVSRWCAGKFPIKVRAVIEICRLYPDITPHELNHVVFPEDLKFLFNNKRKK